MKQTLRSFLVSIVFALALTIGLHNVANGDVLNPSLTIYCISSPNSPSDLRATLVPHANHDGIWEVHLVRLRPANSSLETYDQMKVSGDATTYYEFSTFNSTYDRPHHDSIKTKLSNSYTNDVVKMDGIPANDPGQMKCSYSQW